MPQIENYEIIRKLGEGGMGIVYFAEQKEPVKRRVAVKIIKPGMDSKQVLTRFEAERQTLALLEHPNIARIYDAGSTDRGYPYFVMEYVHGVRITEYCNSNRLAIEQRIELYLLVCDAIHYAHQKGIIHRDIKPSNILVSRQQDRAEPKVIDFGVAKVIGQPLTERTLFTEQGQLIGTPEYMSPEQAELTNQDVDTRSDIYSLGVLLYELLTGTLPFDVDALRAAAFDEIIRIIRDENPPRPSARLLSLGEKAVTIATERSTEIRALSKRLHRELEWIPLKAMRKEPDRRYKTASELADDVRNYLNGNPLMAGPESVAYRARKFTQKHRGLVTAAAAIAGSLLAGFLVSTALYLQAEGARRETETQRQRAEGERELALEAKETARQQAILAEDAQQAAEAQRNIALQALTNKERALAAEKKAVERALEAEEDANQLAEEYRRSLYASQIQMAQREYRQANIGSMRELLRACHDDLRGWEWHYLSRILDQAQMTLRGHGSIVLSVAISPDGRRIASGSVDRTLKIWDAESGAELVTIGGHNAIVNSVAFSPDGDLIVSSEGRTLKVWDVRSGDEVMTLREHENKAVSTSVVSGRVESVVFSPDGTQIAATSAVERFAVKVWDATNGKESLVLRGHRHIVLSVAFSPDNRRLVSGSADTTLKVWDAKSGAEGMTLRGHEDVVTSGTFGPDGRRIVSGSRDDTVRLWDADAGSEVMILRGHSGNVLSVAFTPDGKRIVSSSEDNTLKLWDAESGAELATLRGHEDDVTSVAISLDGSRVVSGSHDNAVKMWDVKNCSELMALTGHEDGVRAVAFSPNGMHIVSGSQDDTLKVWDVESGNEILALRGHADRVFTAAFSPDGKQIVSGSADKTLKVWHAENGTQLMSLRGHKSFVKSAVFSPDGKRIVSGSHDYTLKVWDANSGREVFTLLGHKLPVFSVAFSPDGKWILSGSTDSTLKIWDAESGAELMTLRTHRPGPHGVYSMAFSPDGKRIVSGSFDKTLSVWDANNGAELMTLRGHTDLVQSVTFSPDGKRIVSGSSDKTLKIWDAESGAELITLRGHADEVFSVTFSPDGRRIVSGSQDDTLKVWNAAGSEDIR